MVIGDHSECVIFHLVILTKIEKKIKIIILDRTRGNDRRNDNYRDNRNKPRNVQNQIRSPTQTKEPEPKSATPPPAKKPKRIVNEEDLSDGEIVDSD